MDLVWDVRTAMEEKEAVIIQGILDKNRSKKKDYYIHVCPNWTNNLCNEMKITYILRSAPPPKMLGSKLYKVNNQKSIITKEWELPHDVLVPEESLDMHNISQNVAESVKSIAPAIVMS
jgi:hypothetical protein